MHPQVKPSTGVYRFSHVPVFYVSAASVFYLFFLFASHLLRPISVSSCPRFSFAAALCQQVMQCSHHCCVNVCDKRKNKWDDEKKKQRARAIEGTETKS